MDLFRGGNGGGGGGDGSDSFSCPYPFISPTNVTDDGGYVDGRLCHTMTEDLTCCLPCPMTDWVYGDNFDTLATIPGYVAIVATVGLIFLLLSWAFLPVKQTSRHYLSICLAIAIIVLNLGLIVPLAAKPDVCHNAITPNDMRSDGLCAFTGACIHFGGWAGVMWLFLRSLSLHLQICWNVDAGRKFMFSSLIAGWGIPIIGGTLVLALNGVSYRFGQTCFTNHVHSLEAFWIPLLIVIGTAVVIALATFGYCIKVYVDVLNAPSTSTSRKQEVSTLAVRVGPGEIYRRTRRVFSLQWRGIAVVTIILASVIFYGVVFAFQDNVVRSITHKPRVAADWGICLIQNDGDKNQCLDKVEKYVVSQDLLIAVVILLSFNGLWLLVFLGRWSMVTGWIDLIKGRKPRDGPEMTIVSHQHHDRQHRCSRCDDNKNVYRVVSTGSAASDWPLSPSSSAPFSP